MAVGWIYLALAGVLEVACKRRSNNPSLKRPDNLVAPE